MAKLDRLANDIKFVRDHWSVYGMSNKIEGNLSDEVNMNVTIKLLR